MSRASVSRFGRSGNPNITGSNLGRVKLLTLKLIVVASFSQGLSIIIVGYSKDCLTQCQDNVTEWDIRYWQPGFPVGQHYKVTMSTSWYPF